MRIKSVAEPKERSQPLQITLELAAHGKAPLAISQEQLSIHIYTDEHSYELFVGDASFAKDAPRVFVVLPEKPSILTMSTSISRLEGGLRWSELPPGTYKLRVYINSGKYTEFDYQWLGQTYSDDYKLVIK